MCPRTRSFWTYPRNMSKPWTYPFQHNMALDRGKVFEELLKIFEECREPNWDGYGAHAVHEETYHLARQFLGALSLSVPVPSIGAEPDGHITAEWYRSPQRTLSVSVGPDGDLHYAALLGSERICGTETWRARIPQVLRDFNRAYRGEGQQKFVALSMEVEVRI
jgi:hypothetical protein